MHLQGRNFSGTLKKMNKDKVLQIRFSDSQLAKLRATHGKKLCDWARKVIVSAPISTSADAHQTKPA
jgi:hypothetical protein